MSDGCQDPGEKKWCEVCGSFIAHEYREPHCPPGYCDACWAHAGSCTLCAALVVLAAVLAFLGRFLLEALRV